VIEALKPLEAALPAGNLLNAMEDAVRQFGAALADADPGTGTTLTAMLWSGSQLALVHVGDTRAYLLRAGELFQITHDHSVVQALLDEGKITTEEAESHPQRSLLLRAIAGDGAADPDVSLHDAQAGDRYLLCSDGLTTVVTPGVIRDTLSAPGDPEQAVARLIDLANEAGGPDNIACVVADVVEPRPGSV
jgi:PPM family protein phosphatase